MQEIVHNLDMWDRALFLFLNGFHSPFWDVVMDFITDRRPWFPCYVALGLFLIFKFRWRSIFILLTIGILITASDQFTSGYLKPTVQRLRPCHEPAIAAQAHVVDGCGGQYGFVSSHASNTFAIAAFLSLLLGWRYRAMYLLWPWAAIVTYSRIYVGVHYPGDLVVGGLIGVLLAGMLLLCYYLLLPQRYQIRAGSKGNSAAS